MYERKFFCLGKKEEEIGNWRERGLGEVKAIMRIALIRQEIDVGVGTFNVLEDRLNVVDFSTFLGFDTYTILMRSPEHVSKQDSLIAPFSRQVRNRTIEIQLFRLTEIIGLLLEH